MKVRPFEAYLKQLIEADGSPAIRGVQTFAEAGLRDKPCGLKVTMASGAAVYVQFIRTSVAGEGPDHNDFDIPASRLG